MEDFWGRFKFDCFFLHFLLEAWTEFYLQNKKQYGAANLWKKDRAWPPVYTSRDYKINSCINAWIHFNSRPYYIFGNGYLFRTPEYYNAISNSNT